MRAAARTYSRLLAAGFRRGSTYRLAALGGLIANATFGMLKVGILFATVDAAGGSIAGYDVGAMSAYVWLSQGLLGSVNLFGRTDVAERIKNGDIAVDFVRPLDVQAASITLEVGRSLFALLPRGVPSVLIGVLAVGMTLPTTPLPYLLGLLSVVLAIVVSCTTVYLVAAARFWLVEGRGLELFYMIVSGFLAGLFVPVPLFPHWLRTVAAATPFPAMMQYPVDVLSGRVDVATSVGLVLAQLGWLVLTGALGAVLTRAGRVRLEVQGG